MKDQLECLEIKNVILKIKNSMAQKIWSHFTKANIYIYTHTHTRLISTFKSEKKKAQHASSAGKHKLNPNELQFYTHENDENKKDW